MKACGCLLEQTGLSLGDQGTNRLFTLATLEQPGRARNITFCQKHATPIGTEMSFAVLKGNPGTRYGKTRHHRNSCPTSCVDYVQRRASHLSLADSKR